MSQERKLAELALLNIQNEEVYEWLQENQHTETLTDNNTEDVAGTFNSDDSDRASEHSEHETDTEQSCDSDSDINHNSGGISYLGKDNQTRWLVHPPRPNVHMRRCNIVTQHPGVKGNARNAKSVIDCWKLFFPDTVIQELVINTNIFLGKIRGNYSRERDCCDTNFEEMSALLGLLYMAGIKKAQHTILQELWVDDGTSPECFRATMSMRRFYLLLRALRFDDINDRHIRKETDNLAAIRKVFEDFVSQCKSCYEIGDYSTVDEMLEAFRGRCSFRVYIANKPAKYGIKIYALVDACTFYTSNLEIYAGKQPDGPHKVHNSAASVVKRIAAPILNTGRNITMDNYFTSIPLAKDLLEQKTTIVGTLRKNQKEIPPIFLNTKIRPPCSSIFGFSGSGVLASYIPSRNKNVLILSTLHCEDKIDDDTGEERKPEMVSFYNLTKGAVDVVDILKAQYSVSRISCRWPLTVFFSLLNIAGINSQIIFRENNNNKMARHIYLKNLAVALMKPHLIIRSSIPSLSMDLRKSSAKLAGIQLQKRCESLMEGICAFCPRRKNRKTKKYCKDCMKPLCNEHCKYLCPDSCNTGNE